MFRLFMGDLLQRDLLEVDSYVKENQSRSWYESVFSEVWDADSRNLCES